MDDGWWMMDDGWWMMMDDGWWMMDDGWWMMNDEWWMMNDDDDDDDDDDDGHVHFVRHDTVFFDVLTRGGRRRGQTEGLVVPKLCFLTCCANFRTSKPSGCDVATWVLVCFITLHWASSPFLKSWEPIVKFWILWNEDKHPWLVVNIAGQASALVSQFLTHKTEFVNALTSNLLWPWTLTALTTHHGILPETLFVVSIGNKLLGVLIVQAKLWETGGVVRQPILPRTMGAELWHWKVTARLGREKMQTKNPHGIHGTCANP